MNKQPFQPDDDQINIGPGESGKTPCVVLLMDDEKSILEPYGKLLEMKGYIVYTASDGVQAIAIYRRLLSSQQKVDVAIIDLTIPEGMGGLETIAQIKEFDPDVRAIATTGHFQEYLTEECRKHGFVELLLKPYLLNELIEAIERAIRKGMNNPE